jgi:hypothetical protein
MRFVFPFALLLKQVGRSTRGATKTLAVIEDSGLPADVRDSRAGVVTQLRNRHGSQFIAGGI